MIQKNIDDILCNVVGDKQQVVVEVDVEEAGVAVEVALAVEVVDSVEGVLQGVAEVPLGVVAVVVDLEAEADFRVVTFCNSTDALVCYPFWISWAYNYEKLMLNIVATLGVSLEMCLFHIFVYPKCNIWIWLPSTALNFTVL